MPIVPFLIVAGFIGVTIGGIKLLMRYENSYGHTRRLAMQVKSECQYGGVLKFFYLKENPHEIFDARGNSVSLTALVAHYTRGKRTENQPHFYICPTIEALLERQS